MTGTLHEDARTFMIIPRLILLRMTNVQICGKIETYFMLNTFFFPKIVRL